MKLAHVFIVIALSSQALIFNACAPYQEDPAVEILPTDKEVTLSVLKMSCDRCLQEIEGAFKGNQAIKSIKAELRPRDNVKVVYDPEKITLEEIKKTISKTLNKEVE